MIQTPEDRRPPLTPQLALRVAVVGSCALAMFAIIFFRLWFLQVLSGDQYLARAGVNYKRTVAIAAPRGEILDRNGNILVESQPTTAVQLSPPDLPVPVTPANIAHPPPRDLAFYNRLAHVVGMPTRRTGCQVVGYGKHLLRLSPIACDVAQQVALQPYADVTIKTDIPKAVHYYLA